MRKRALVEENSLKSHKKMYATFLINVTSQNTDTLL